MSKRLVITLYRMKDKLIKKRDEVIASGKPFKGEIRGVKYGKGTTLYIEYLDTHKIESLEDFISVTNTDKTAFAKLLNEVVEVSNEETKRMQLISLKKYSKSMELQKSILQSLKEKKHLLGNMVKKANLSTT
jgi:hypothetical protein